MFGNGEEGKENLGEIIIYLGRNVEVKGNLNFEGSGRIDGRVEGKITVKGILILGEEGTVSSEIEGDTVIIGGKVEGKIVGRQKVQLLRTSVVNADVMTPCFSIEEGAQFNGSCRMSGEPGEAASTNHSHRGEKSRAAVTTR